MFKLFGENGDLRLFALVFSLIPALFLFLLIHLFLNFNASLLIFSLILVILSIANYKKLLLTGEPISISDLLITENISIVSKYLLWWHWIFIVVFILIFVFSLFLSFNASIKSFCKRFFFILLLIPFVFHLDFYKTKFDFFSYENFLLKHGVFYHNWDANFNYKSNGLLLHLAHTSWAKLPDYKNTDKEAFESLKSEYVQKSISNSGSVFFIQCE
ncbi:MAG: hypothetical protein ACN6NT_02345, partial [Comamonas sp.]